MSKNTFQDGKGTLHTHKRFGKGTMKSDKEKALDQK